MMYTIESESHQIVLFTRVIWFTPRLYDHTEVVHVHTRNKFIHTEIEQTIPYSILITLHQVISYSKLPPLTHTNGTDTHEESGRNPHGDISKSTSRGACNGDVTLAAGAGRRGARTRRCSRAAAAV